MSETLSPDDLALLDRLAAEAIDPIAPPPSAREAVMRAIRQVPGSHESRTVRADEGTWSTVAPGARMKRLAKDKRRGTLTFLLELDPHAVVPEHDHEGAEESFVVRGSCHIGALALNTGDYHQAAASAHHGDVVASGEGCLLLITVEVAAA